MISYQLDAHNVEWSWQENQTTKKEAVKLITSDSMCYSRSQWCFCKLWSIKILFSLKTGSILQYPCHVGHRISIGFSSFILDLLKTPGQKISLNHIIYMVGYFWIFLNIPTWIFYSWKGHVFLQIKHIGRPWASAPPPPPMQSAARFFGPVADLSLWAF